MQDQERKETSIAALRFLVTEDHDVQRSALVMALRRLGATIVHEAADGRGALKILEDPARPGDQIVWPGWRFFPSFQFSLFAVCYKG